MSTRGLYTFIDDRSEIHVYRHHDNYPTGAAGAIADAVKLAWPLPRFEADEFAAAFVAANKPDAGHPGGSIRLMPSGKWRDVAPRDIQYRYEIKRTGESVFTESPVIVTAYEVSCDWKTDKWTERELWSGPITELTTALTKVEADELENAE